MGTQIIGKFPSFCRDVVKFVPSSRTLRQARYDPERRRSFSSPSKSSPTLLCCSETLGIACRKTLAGMFRGVKCLVGMNS